LTIAAAPFLLAHSAGDFEPVWLAPSMPAWTALAGILCAVVALAGGIVLIVRSRPAIDRAAHYIGAVVGTLIAIIPFWALLWRLVNLLAVLMTIPYSIGLPGLVLWMRRPRAG
jgi:hypothetical protein